MGMQSRFVWMDGNLVEYERATIPFPSASPELSNKFQLQKEGFAYQWH